VYWYAPASELVQERIKEVARKAFLAVQGSGYGRVDIRTATMDSEDPIVLEVNANCGISFNPNEFTSTVGEVSAPQ
jgi:D-alanine-D-alanine ligase-like ATP-grasp enzyme